eukprot:508797_1
MELLLRRLVSIFLVICVFFMFKNKPDIGFKLIDRNSVIKDNLHRLTRSQYIWCKNNPLIIKYMGLFNTIVGFGISFYLMGYIGCYLGRPAVIINIFMIFGVQTMVGAFGTVLPRPNEWIDSPYDFPQILKLFNTHKGKIVNKVLFFSGHTSVGIYGLCLCFKYYYNSNTYLQYIPWFILICFTAQTIKLIIFRHHYTIDIFTGLIIGTLCYLLVPKMDKIIEDL